MSSDSRGQTGSKALTERSTGLHKVRRPEPWRYANLASIEAVNLLAERMTMLLWSFGIGRGLVFPAHLSPQQAGGSQIGCKSASCFHISQNGSPSSQSNSSYLQGCFSLAKLLCGILKLRRCLPWLSARDDETPLTSCELVMAL